MVPTHVRQQPAIDYGQRLVRKPVLIDGIGQVQESVRCSLRLVLPPLLV